MDSLYGNYRHRKFTDIFPSYEEFQTEASANPLTKNLKATDVEETYYLLYAKYGNSVIASSDENQFKFQLWSIMYDTTPAWSTKNRIQHELYNLSEDDLRAGYQTIMNHASNPSADPATDAMTPLNKVDDQSVNGTKRDKITAYTRLWEIIRSNLTKGYINNFGKLFLLIVEPELPLWYITDTEED